MSNCCIITMMVHLQPTKSVIQSVSSWQESALFYSPPRYFPRKLAMAVAAMVARQMRENQQRKDGPSSNWTEEERNLFELQQKSKSTLKVTDIILAEVKVYYKMIVNFLFQSELVQDILEKNKPPPPGPPKYYNLPLLLSLLVLLLGLLLTSLSFYDESKTSIAVKCLASSLVFAGTTAFLLRILYFSSTTNDKNTHYKCDKSI